jgi:hypothetical protein
MCSKRGSDNLRLCTSQHTVRLGGAGAALRNSRNERRHALAGSTPEARKRNEQPAWDSTVAGAGTLSALMLRQQCSPLHIRLRLAQFLHDRPATT